MLFYKYLYLYYFLGDRLVIFIQELFEIDGYVGEDQVNDIAIIECLYESYNIIWVYWTIWLSFKTSSIDNSLMTVEVIPLLPTVCLSSLMATYWLCWTLMAFLTMPKDPPLAALILGFTFPSHDYPVFIVEKFFLHLRSIWAINEIIKFKGHI